MGAFSLIVVINLLNRYKMAQKLIVVTGSYKGIGYEIVRLLCEHYGPSGATVFMTARSAGKAKESFDSLKSRGMNIVFAELDITSRDSAAKFKSLIEKEYGGKIDSLINNAAMAFKRAATEPFAQQAKETVENNYFGHLNVCDQLLPLIPNGGVVVNVASRAGVRSQVSDEYQKILTEAENIDDVTIIMNKFVAAAQEGKQKEAGFSNSAYGMSKLGMIAAGKVHSKQLKARDQS